MATSRAMALMLLVALAFACFVSAPVMSGEHPWDADNTGGGTDGNLDTLIDITIADTAGVNSVPSNGPDTISLMAQMTAWLAGVAQVL